MYKFLFEELMLAVNIECKICGQVLKHNFDENVEEQKKKYVCSCGKCTLLVLPRKRVFAAKGNYIDNSISVLEPITSGRDWRI